MILHHYPLQAHLYLVALHRFLKWRLPNYSPDKHLGGYAYVFLRGVPDNELFALDPSVEKVPGLIVEKAPLNRVMQLNKLFEEGGA